MTSRSKPTDRKRTARTQPATNKRRYNSEIRQQQSNQTRELIIASGVALAHEFPSWDWKNLTFRAISERAGISERTVYRYFPTEQALKNAVIQQLVKESGIDLNALNLAEFATTIKGLFQYMLSFSARTKPDEDPAFQSVDHDRRMALLRSVVEATPGWSEAQQEIVTAALDILWQPSTYERLLNGWNFDPETSLAALTWLIDLILQAVDNGQRPAI